ncbi:hypothetical protein O6H91_06G060300 [Diphasiastrum complanatum]|uniref:Uncharacterized protein n=7 Tax=Diphasiastrum complanatum TaxID=34168 RepID=A0ACC2DEF5_DIPCM|nr:hypothetical protein O6H91_06G060300 [Diphasiastrum complanatum]KAJ7552558.1 hypothetical protein O6H91_06G060300 [Diphasiastrum complanatum]KAJ7552559.1 hypothetical protein O6H91_06G060300 [Diphasiastrum complanatum]KAJ7552560.1 hypothetical protein O6H91_06G060300 [Diphasiastrum complanatum]KAJ7552562.1 hypothetical protein O6H91_06G060300 [Diphasiastrum complanatum]
MKKRCRAENTNCGLETGKSVFQGPLKCLRCELCCEEPGFCRECTCLLCCKALKPSLEENFTIRCLHRISQAGICGHAAHLHCALDSQMAGVVKLRGIDMEYLCRRCDKKTDLKDVISHLIEGMTKVTVKPCAEKMLKLALRTIQGSQRGGRETKMLESTAHWALDKIKKGEDIQTLFKAVADGSDSKAEDEGLHQSKASLGHLLTSCSSPSPMQVSTIPSSFVSPNLAASTPIVVSSTLCVTVESKATKLSLGFRQEGNSMADQDTSHHFSKKLHFDSNGPAVAEACSEQTTSDADIDTLSIKSLEQAAENDGTSIAIATQMPQKAQAEAGLLSKITKEESIMRAAVIPELKTNGFLTGCQEPEHDGPVYLGIAKDSLANQATTPVSDSFGANLAYDIHHMLPCCEDTADEGINSHNRDTKPVAAEAPMHAPETSSLPSKVLLDSQYDRDIQDALEKLKNRHLGKYSFTKQCLVTKKKEVMDQYQQLNSARHNLATQAPSMSEEEVAILVENIVSQAACLEKERVMFEELLWRCRKID